MSDPERRWRRSRPLGRCSPGAQDCARRRPTHPTHRRGARGRPRNPELDDRILDATLELLSREGFSRMSVEAVAAAAGVPKPTVYRRWVTKADLATAALARLQSRETPPRGRSARARLIGVLGEFRRNLLRPGGMSMLGTLLAEEEHHPELIRLFRQRIVMPRRRMIRDVLEDGVDAGEIRSDADLDAVINMVVGSFHARYLTGESVPASWPRRVVAALWDGIGR